MVPSVIGNAYTEAAELSVRIGGEVVVTLAARSFEDGKPDIGFIMQSRGHMGPADGIRLEGVRHTPSTTRPRRVRADNADYRLLALKMGSAPKVVSAIVSADAYGQLAAYQESRPQSSHNSRPVARV